MNLKNCLFTLLVLGMFSQAFAENREPTGNFPTPEYSRVAAIQFSPPGDAPINVAQSVVDSYKKLTADRLESQIREAARTGAKLVVTPEFGTVGYPDIPELPSEEDEFQNREQVQPYTEDLRGPTAQRFSALAKELGIWLTIGIVEVDRTTDIYYNTMLAINPQGLIATTYRKVNLFQLENNFLSAGTTRSYFDTDFGRFGIFTCYDIHFSHPARDLVTKDGVDGIAFSTSWVGEEGIKTFANFARSNNVFFIAANHTYYPDSGVISPDGTIQSHIRRLMGPVFGYVKNLR